MHTITNDSQHIFPVLGAIDKGAQQIQKNWNHPAISICPKYWNWNIVNYPDHSYMYIIIIFFIFNNKDVDKTYNITCWVRSVTLKIKVESHLQIQEPDRWKADWLKQI